MPFRSKCPNVIEKEILIQVNHLLYSKRYHIEVLKIESGSHHRRLDNIAFHYLLISRSTTVIRAYRIQTHADIIKSSLHGIFGTHNQLRAPSVSDVQEKRYRWNQRNKFHFDFFFVDFVVVVSFVLTQRQFAP